MRLFVLATSVSAQRMHPSLWLIIAVLLGSGWGVGPASRLLAAGTWSRVIDLPDDRVSLSVSTWTTVSQLPSLGRRGVAVTTGLDGRIYIIGGSGPTTPTNAVEVWDPQTSSWPAVPGMLSSRSYPGAATGPNGWIYVVGGFSQSQGNLLASMEAYDPVAKNWAVLPSMPTARYTHAVVAGKDGRIYALGGSGGVGNGDRVEVFDTVTNLWTTLAPMPMPRSSLAAVTASDGRIYVMGGNYPGHVPAHDVDVYDPVQNTWVSAVTRLPSPTIWREAPAATRGLDGKIYLIGGVIGSGTWSNTVDVFDPKTNTWGAIPPMQFRREGHGATTGLDGRIYVAGGGDDHFNPEVESYGSTTAALVVSTEIPSSVEIVNGQYNPNPFDITATVINGGGTTATDVQVTLSLPPGFSLASGSVARSIGTLPSGQQQRVAWNVRTEGQVQQVNLPYFVTAASSNTAAAYARRDITLPGGVLTVRSITPNVGGDTGFVTATIHGGGFQPGATVKLTRAGQPDIVGSNVRVSSDGASLTATFDLAGKARGEWDIAVTVGSQSSILATPFGVVESVGPLLTLQLVGPSVARVGRNATLYAVVGNDGNIDLHGVTVSFGDPVASVSAISPEFFVPPGSLSAMSLSTSISSQGAPAAANTMFVGDLGPLGRWIGSNIVSSAAERCFSYDLDGEDECAEAYRKLAVSLSSYLSLRAIVSYYDWRYDQNSCDSPQASSDCSSIIENLVGAQSSLSLAEGKLVADCTSMSSRCPLKALCTALSRAISIESIAEFSVALEKVKRAQIKSSTAETCFLSSFDPNAIYGPAGRSTQRYLPPRIPMSYIVTFENLPAASAAAQEVVITDQLDSTKVELSTFTLGPIAFGNRAVTPPSGLSQWSADIDLRPAQNLILRINAGVDMTTGLATWRFISLDPATMLPTEDALAGFLPPNVTSPEGEGSVLFTVSPKSGLATGTEIRNKARIVFDTNAPIDTPEWLNTIDANAPSSQVQALASTQAAATFTVTWSGADQGAGIGDYTVSVSENGGPFVPWLVNTTATSADFTGVSGSTYAFYSVARDLVGNQEAAPSGPDTTTQVLVPTPTPTITATTTVTETATATPTASETPSPTATETPTITPSATSTETPTLTPFPTDTPSPTATGTETPTPTPTACPTGTSLVGASCLPITPTFTLTSPPTATFTVTPTPTLTFTPTASATVPPTITPTATPLPSITPTATMTLVPSGGMFRLDEFVVFSAERTWLFAETDVLSGNVGANSALPCNPRGDNCPEVILGRSVEMPAGSTVVGDTLRLGPLSRVANAAYNEKDGPGQITGVAMTPLSLPVFNLPPIASCTPGRSSVTLAPGQSRTLPPGAYGSLTVRSGATITLMAGAYCVSSVDIERGGRLYAAGPVNLTVLGDLDVGAQAIIAPAPVAATLRASDLMITVFGFDRRESSHGGFGAADRRERPGRGDEDDDDDDEHDDEPDGGRWPGGMRAVDIGPRSTIRANILAPNGSVRLGSDTQATGAFIGQRVRVGIRSRLTLDSAFGP